MYSNHDFGVPSGNATPDRAEYTLDSAISLEGSLGMFVEITRDWLVVLSTSIESLDRDVIDSPIVGEEYIIKGLAVISVVF